MIDSRELRIGNLVIGMNGLPCEITAYDYEHSDFDVMLPIPLTPEILEKCGFVKNGVWAQLDFPTRLGIRFYNWNYAECDLIQDDKFIAFKNSHITYLHQLQNLYFALTQTEITINQQSLK